MHVHKYAIFIANQYQEKMIKETMFSERNRISKILKIFLNTDKEFHENS